MPVSWDYTSNHKYHITKWFQIFGPFEYLNGLVVYLKELDPSQGYAGLFNNPNCAGLWLSALIFCFLMLQKYKYKNKVKFYYYHNNFYYLLHTY